MNTESAVDIIRATVGTAMLLVAPILLTCMAVGLLVGLVQSVTSIQEQTLTFVPKLLAVALVTVAGANWMVRTLIEFCTGFFQRIPEMAL